jgi:hypothetical protein
MKTTITQKLTRNLAILSFVLGSTLPTTVYAQQKPDVLAQLSRTELNSQTKNRQCRSPLFGEIFARTELFFGLSKPDGSEVSNKDFQDFVNAQVTPRFPDGLTLLSGTGQFRDSSGTIIREKSRLLILLYPFNNESNGKIEEVREAYKSQFQQQSVLRVDESSCVSF